MHSTMIGKWRNWFADEREAQAELARRRTQIEDAEARVEAMKAEEASLVTFMGTQNWKYS